MIIINKRGKGMMTKENISKNFISLLNVRRKNGRLALNAERNGDKDMVKKYKKLIYDINKNLSYLSKRHRKAKL